MNQSDEQLTERFEFLSSRVYNDDLILQLPVKTLAELAVWKEAMSSGILPHEYRLLAAVVEEIKGRRSMKNVKMPKRVSKRGRVFVGVPTFKIGRV